MAVCAVKCARLHPCLSGTSFYSSPFVEGDDLMDLLAVTPRLAQMLALSYTCCRVRLSPHVSHHSSHLAFVGIMG